MEQSAEMITKFTEQVLAVIWDDFQVLVWNLENKFDIYIGRDIKMFISHIPEVVTFFQKNFNPYTQLVDFWSGCEVWYQICPFLWRARIDDCENYGEAINDFKMNVELFYKYGSTTFLTKNEVGDQETFYTHCLCYYMPKHAEDTYRDHGLTLGIYTMQGFERRNKESKACLRRFSNNKEHKIVANIKRLWDIFVHGMAAI